MAIQGEGRAFDLIRCEDSEAWLRLRKEGVGGSDVAAIMGLSKWRTPAQVYVDKISDELGDDLSDKPYIRFGNLMEPVVGEEYERQHPGFTVRRVNAVCRSIDRPWAQASLDYEVRDPDRKGWGVLEIKTARNADDWADGVPDYYLTQVTHYMSVTCRSYADVAVFFRDTCEFGFYRIERDEEDIDLVDSAVDTFWNEFVLKRVEPELVGTADEGRMLAELHTPSDGEFATPEDVSAADELIAAYRDACEREKAAKDDKAKAATLLKGIIGDAKGIQTDVARVTWVRSESRRFDSKRFKSERPDDYEQYTVATKRDGGLRIKES